jgi:hypothetical protein
MLKMTMEKRLTHISTTETISVKPTQKAAVGVGAILVWEQW